MPGWLPDEIGLSIEGGQLSCVEGQDLQVQLQQSKASTHLMAYDLVGFVAEIDSGEQQATHLVSLINGMLWHQKGKKRVGVRNTAEC